MDWEIAVGSHPEAVYENALAVRKAVFVEEQDVPEEIEVDEHEATATHFAAYDPDGEPAGAARLREIDDDTGKVERVAVVPEHRESGLGTALMERLEALARERELTRLRMHSQVRAAPFYESLGYQRVGERFEEAGIPHIEMRKSL